ncbi:MAG: hypothetical protein L6R38_004344 [Xanthoria sp. 2 TBL-2021]|nr:MAG: hypothetical protein L6R38_004344 [Xanthoria sp. 2 TBL-2021]
MSLNGLDATDINEAFQSALAEGGGWFLLKYATRDEVTLLNRGSGGVVDIRDTVAQYDDQSPLYGFVHYRRRKVILKYIPEGTSRVLRARVAVHFQAITDHFTPHDTIYSFTSAKGLNDVALSAACSLHTASASIKSSSDSLRQRGLSGIAEDIGEYQPPATDIEPAEEEKRNSNGTPALQNRPERTDSLSIAKATTAQPSIEHRGSTSPTRARNIDKALPPTPNERTEDKATTRNALEDTLLDSRPSAEGRPSIQSTRPSVRSTHTSYESKHKLKLGPRPSLDSSARFHSQDRSGPIRPVSTLPNGVRLAARKQAPARSQSIKAHPPTAETLEDPPSSQKPSSPIVPKETPPPLPAGLPKQLQLAENRTSAMTPEKRRLKKALELRQKQLAAKRAQELAEAEEVQGHPVQPSCDLGKRESLTATLPDLSPADDSTTDVLQERIDALDRNPDLVHVGPQNVDKGVSESFEVSPISVLEASDGPSSQASSVSDEEETPSNTDPVAANEVINGSPVDAFAHDQSISGARTLTEPEHPLSDGRGDTPEPSGTDECKAEQPIAKMTPANQDDRHGEEVSLSTAPRDSPESSESKISVQGTADKVPLISEPSDSLHTPVSNPVHISTDNLIPHEIPLPISDEEELGIAPEEKAIAELPLSNPYNEDAARQHLAPYQTQEGNASLRGSRSSTDDIPKEQRERRARRHGLVSPIKRVSSPDYSDEQFLSDDSFMEELKSATVQEAKPISVSKSPIMPVFPRSVPDSKSTEELRPASVSSHLERPKRRNDLPMMPKLPDLYSARSSSAPYAPLHEAQLSSPTLKKVGVSSGISQRIKLLEQLSSRPTSPSSQLSSPSTALGSSPAFPSTRKTSFRASQAAAEIARFSTQNSKSRPQLPHLPKSRSPDRSSSSMRDSVVRIDVATKTGKARPESISVTARIIRGSHNRISDVPEDVSRPRTSDLYPSPLTVEHQSMKPTSPPLSPLKPPNPRYARSMSSTSTAQKSDLPRRDSISSRLSSTPSRRGSEPELPRSMSDLSINSMSNLDGLKDDKKESRKSRLFKRMSNISAASRRSIASALSPVRKDIKEEAIVEHHEPSRETIKPLAVEVGDVNIQFPDTLLWKRRHMKIDDEGLLVLSASKSDNNSKIIPKRYPFTEFKSPYLPDQDQQELPNSVVLDFRDGSTLQCACENPYAQTEVLQALKRAHKTSNSAR